MQRMKLWPFVGAICMSLVGSAYADGYYGSGSLSNEAQGQTSHSNQGGYSRGSYREITPNAGPRVAHGADLFLTADFIWWYARQGGTEFGSLGERESLTTPAFEAGKVEEVGKKWSPGFKVGLGANLGHDGWDICARYTWLQPKNSNAHLKSASDRRVMAYTSRFLGGAAMHPYSFVKEAVATWKLRFNAVDLELGRNFYLSQYLTMRPSIGLKATWQDQKQTITYNSDQFELPIGADAALTPVTGPDTLFEHSKSWGIGTRAGWDTAWFFSKECCLYGNLAMCALWTVTDTASLQEECTQNVGAEPLISSTLRNVEKPRSYAVNPVVEWGIGMRWGTWFSDSSYYFGIQAGWEQQIWMNWKERFAASGQRNDLSFHGLNLRLRFDF